MGFQIRSAWTKLALLAAGTALVVWGMPAVIHGQQVAPHPAGVVASDPTDQPDSDTTGDTHSNTHTGAKKLGAGGDDRTTIPGHNTRDPDATGDRHSHDHTGAKGVGAGGEDRGGHGR